MLLRYLPLFLLALCCCNTADSEWQTLDAGKFKIRVPPGWAMIKMRGMESNLGAFVNDRDTLSFSYGSYYTELSFGNTDYKQAIDTINGFTAVITVPRYAGKGIVAARILGDSGFPSLTIQGENIASTDTVLEIFKSITFAAGNTSMNPVLSEEKFLPLKEPHTGKALYQMNCAACHNIRKEAIGPPLYNTLEINGVEGIYKLLTDSSLLSGKKRHSVWFNNLSKADVISLLMYTSN